jgi:hypothetical protein
MGCDQSQEQASKTTRVVKEPTGSIFEHGIYKPVRKGRVLDSLESNTGKLISLSVLQLNEATDRIPMVKGTYFAFRYRVYNLLKEDAKKPVVEMRKVLIHPTMTLPDGTTTTGWERTDKQRSSAGQVIAFDGYAFNEDYELVEGEWRFQIWYRDKMMVEQKFTTYRPEEASTESKAVAPATENKI